jgi:hypothetical protein
MVSGALNRYVSDRPARGLGIAIMLDMWHQPRHVFHMRHGQKGAFACMVELASTPRVAMTELDSCTKPARQMQGGQRVASAH